MFYPGIWPVGRFYRSVQMRKIIVTEFITLDGVMQAQMKPPFDLLLGRKTYEIFASYWPQHAKAWPGVNEAKKYVVSHELEWEHSILLKDDVVAKIQKL